MYQGLLPAPSSYLPPAIPPLSTLFQQIIQSRNRLFFVSHSIGTASSREWRLVRVNLDKSMATNPTCMQDGQFLVEFYILHSANTKYNGINQRYWLQYHKASDIITPTLATAAHLIKPTDISERLVRDTSSYHSDNGSTSPTNQHISVGL